MSQAVDGRGEVVRLRVKLMSLEDRCQRLDTSLRVMKDILRSKDEELGRLKRERDRLLTERITHDQSVNLRQRRNHSRQSRRKHRQRSSQSGARTPEQDQNNSRPSKEGEGEDGMDLIASMSPTSISQEEQRARIQSMEVFMTKTDSWSGTQIIQAVQDLNAEVLQYAASAAELCLSDRTVEPTRTKHVQALENTASRLGPGFAQIISDCNDGQSLILVQYALQACVLKCIMPCFSSFCVGLPPKPDIFFNQIYQRMCSSEPQPASSQWRALTHRYIYALHPQMMEQSILELNRTIVRWSSDVFVAANCSSSATSIDVLSDQLGQQTRRIAQATCRMARVLKEDILSTNFVLSEIGHGAVFDQDDMADAMGGCTLAKGKVLCTTDMGLACVTETKVGEFERKVLLRPRVILDSAVNLLRNGASG